MTTMNVVLLVIAAVLARALRDAPPEPAEPGRLDRRVPTL